MTHTPRELPDMQDLTRDTVNLQFCSDYLKREIVKLLDRIDWEVAKRLEAGSIIERKDAEIAGLRRRLVAVTTCGVACKKCLLANCWRIASDAEIAAWSASPAPDGGVVAKIRD